MKRATGNHFASDSAPRSRESNCSTTAVTTRLNWRRKRSHPRSFYFTRSSDEEDSLGAVSVTGVTETSSPPASEIVNAPITSRFSKSLGVEFADGEAPSSRSRCGNSSQTPQTDGSASRSSSAISRGNRNLKWRHVLTHLIYRHLPCRIEDIPVTIPQRVIAQHIRRLSCKTKKARPRPRL